MHAWHLGGGHLGVSETEDVTGFLAGDDERSPNRCGARGVWCLQDHMISLACGAWRGKMMITNSIAQVAGNGEEYITS